MIKSTGSSAILVHHQAFDRNEPGAQQLNACSPVHGPLQGLAFVDLSFGLTVALRFRDRVARGLKITHQPPGE
jgi:hypothetical protein